MQQNNSTYPTKATHAMKSKGEGTLHMAMSQSKLTLETAWSFASILEPLGTIGDRDCAMQVSNAGEILKKSHKNNECGFHIQPIHTARQFEIASAPDAHGTDKLSQNSMCLLDPPEGQQTYSAHVVNLQDIW